jgi:hypothetical protein
MREAIAEITITTINSTRVNPARVVRIKKSLRISVRWLDRLGDLSIALAS